MSWPRGRRGQIVIPALLIFPTLMLFVYLIYETAKLSREKIRHQFAMDAAAFVEMTNYSDFLNRTAYVNGAFPMRIFEEGYYDFYAECEGKATNGTCNRKTYAKLLFDNSAFPDLDGAYIDPKQQPVSSITGGQWKIEYGGPYAAEKNANPPQLDRVDQGDNNQNYELFTEDNADYYWHPYDLATEIYKLYVQIYSLLGSVEDAQFQVLTRLTTGGGVPHSFLQKSYWLNTGDPVGDAVALSHSFDTALGDFNHSVHPACLQVLDYWGNKHLNGGIQPYVPQKTIPPGVLMTPQNGIAGTGCQSSDNGPGQGLFQIEYLDQPMADTLKKGLTLEMPWSIPSSNFFNIDFNALMAQSYPNRELHTTISVIGDPNNSPSVWPDPTPKFQVRQFP
ncbi:MAG TPA: hypothetical protein VH309_07670 [Elusimicrobiota bacterium]|jgi:hypothetical protein|nr:hypothetical protein [Elusimicrobiota bacterium]